MPQYNLTQYNNKENTKKQKKVSPADKGNYCKMENIPL
jgi:hypothetical protein